MDDPMAPDREPLASEVRVFAGLLCVFALAGLLALGATLRWSCAPAPPAVVSARPPWLPDPRLTPGAVLPVDARTVCERGYAGGARHVSEAMKRRVYRAYGIAPDGKRYEVDHLIPLCLGGSNEQANLWPEPYGTTPGAHEKDRLEVQLYLDVCAGRITLREAQDVFRGDWTKALKGRNLP